jgi:hypothetical protein
LLATFLYLLLAIPSAPDVLVVCPGDLRPGLSEWAEYRRGQGHEILIIEPPNTPADLRAAIRRTAKAGRLKYLVLIGDVTDASSRAHDGPHVPTNYAPAKVNTRWGSQPTIATDIPYADLNEDGIPDLAVGRLPADSVSDLSAIVRKTIHYEQQAESGAWERRLNIVTGAGGFGAVTDAIIEATARQVIRQVVPQDVQVQHYAVRQNPPPGPASRVGERFAPTTTEAVQRQLSEGCLAWIYLGHGMPTQLDATTSATRGSAPILSVENVSQLRCGSQRPLAVLVACYTGAYDAPRDCLAEELALAEEGPVAVIAATRVTMPYGNTVFGYELLQACFKGRGITLGDMLLSAQRQSQRDSTEEPLRKSLDSLAQGLSPPPVELAAERAEHVLMYHLFGDPLLRLRIPRTSLARSHAADAAAK